MYLLGPRGEFGLGLVVVCFTNLGAQHILCVCFFGSILLQYVNPALCVETFIRDYVKC